MTDHPLDADTRVAPTGDGAFTATVSDRWDNLLGSPLGGYLVAICLRALREVLPIPEPLVLAAFFLRPGQAGPAEVRTEPVRAGRRTATGAASLVQEGRERVRVLATFADLERATGRTAMLGTPPKLPPPEDTLDPLAGLPLEAVSLAERIELRTAEPPGWLHGQPSGKPAGELWARLKGDREHDLLALAVLADALPLAILELGEPGSTTLEMTVHFRAHPAAGWLACRNATRHVINGLHEEDAELWDSSGHLVAQSRQLAMLPQRR